jgi:hypothetical protein
MTIEEARARHFIVRSTIQALLLHQNRCESTGLPSLAAALAVSKQPAKHPRGKKLLASNAVHRIGLRCARSRIESTRSRFKGNAIH